MQTRINSEHELIEFYSEQLRRYETLETLLKGLNVTSEYSANAYNNIKRLLGEIEASDKQNMHLKSNGQSILRTASPQLRSIVDRIRETLENMIAHTSRSEAAARDVREKVLAQLSDDSMRRKVVAAYGG
ncbi:MAG: hypothetical protein KDB27_04260 [Planctomycetales bacterium]|nr:hypothetical protein [Planctomycetales bacterium]